MISKELLDLVEDGFVEYFNQVAIQVKDELMYNNKNDDIALFLSKIVGEIVRLISWIFLNVFELVYQLV